MAVTIANRQIVYRGPIIQMYAEVTLDSSYASGGESISASDFGLAEILAVVVTADSGYNVKYAKTNAQSGTLVVYAAFTPDTNSLLAAPLASSVGRDLSTVTVALVIYGR